MYTPHITPLALKVLEGMSTDTKAAVITALREARVLVVKGWTQGVNARDKNGDPAMLWPSGCAEPPVCWCLHGAIAMASDTLRRGGVVPYDIQVPAADQLSVQLERTGWQPKEENKHWFVQYNDDPGRTVEDILTLIDNTIAHIEESKV